MTSERALKVTVDPIFKKKNLDRLLLSLVHLILLKSMAEPTSRVPRQKMSSFVDIFLV